MKNRPNKPCGNCGADSFAQISTAGKKFALITVDVANLRPTTKLKAGFWVELYFCENCGAVQLFTDPEKPVIQ